MTRYLQAFALSLSLSALTAPVFTSAVFAAPPAVPTKPVPAKVAPASVTPDATRLGIFDFVWRTVRDGHYDPQMNGVNWNAVRVKYLPKATAAKDEAAFYGVLNAMLGELKESHLAAMSPTALGAETKIAPATATTKDAPGKDTANAAPSRSATGDSGITAEWIDGKALVVRVAEKSAGAEAGVKPGYVLTTLGGKSVASAVEAYLKAQPRATESPVMAWMILRAGLNGVVGKPYTLGVVDPSGAAQTLTVTPRKPAGQIVTFGALPPIAADIETKTLAGGVGYVRFSIFLIPLLQPVKDAVRDFAAKDAPAIIFDLRGNPGGIGAMAGAIAGTFSKAQVSLGTMKMRTASMKFLAYPQSPRYTGKIVILTDESSISTSEIMAGGLQESGRATVIGRRTAGMVLPSQIVTLPDGGRLQYVVGDFRTPKGVFLEGRGVSPDITVLLTPETLTASPSGDPVLDAAIQFINTNTKNTTADTAAKETKP